MNCPINPIPNKNPAKTNEPEIASSHFIDIQSKYNEAARIPRPISTKPFGMIK